MAERSAAPAMTGVHHFSPTVSDVEASASWYQRVFGMERLPVTFPHHDDEASGFAVLLMDPRSGLAIGLHHHESNGGERSADSDTGLDHIGFGVTKRADLDTWAAWLDELGVEHTGVRDITDPVPFATLVFRDPDNIQLELIHMPV